MKALHVIHGYPPYYMAGSEVYTYHLTKELSKFIDLSIFTRIENSYDMSYTYFDEKEGNIQIRRVNKPQRDYTFKDKYLDENIDKLFSEYIEEIKPDIIHISHLSHLSTNIVNIIKEEFGLPIVFTLHDFWLHCFRGQLVDPSLKICQGPGNDNCFSCAKTIFKNWIGKDEVMEYRNHMDRVINNIDLFLCPSKFLRDFFIQNGVEENEIIYSKYGFNKKMISQNDRYYQPGSSINFGFMGRVIPVKGIRILLEAFSELDFNVSRLSIYGDLGSDELFLKRYSNENVKFYGGYNNWEINSVLDQIDILVVPSIWYENAPLVIQEAFLAGIPVITSNIGGMAELVENGIDGFTFEVGDKESLKGIMGKILSDPQILNDLKTGRDKIRSIEDDAKSVLGIYQEVIK